MVLLATPRCNHPSMVHRVGLVMGLKSQSSFSNVPRRVNSPKNQHNHDKNDAFKYNNININISVMINPMFSEG